MLHFFDLICRLRFFQCGRCTIVFVLFCLVFLGHMPCQGRNSTLNGTQWKRDKCWCLLSTFRAKVLSLWSKRQLNHKFTLEFSLKQTNWNTFWVDKKFHFHLHWNLNSDLILVSCHWISAQVIYIYKIYTVYIALIDFYFSFKLFNFSFTWFSFSNLSISTSTNFISISC